MKGPGQQALRKGRFSVPGGLYFLTFCTERRKPLLACDGVWEAGLEEIRVSEIDRVAVVHALVLMPDHVHLIGTLGETLSLSAWVGRFKTRVRNAAGVAWERGFYDHFVRQAEALQPIYHYIYNNPARSGLLKKREVWPYFWVHPRDNHGFDPSNLFGDSTIPDWLK